MKIKFPKRKKEFKKGGFHTNPDISWEIVMYMAFAFIFASCIYGFIFFREINKEFVASTENTIERTKVTKKERVENVLKYFNEREKMSKDILNSPSSLGDPSL